MIMPFLRLVIIYIVVIFAAVLFFKRDTVLPLLGFSGEVEQTAKISAPTEPANPPTTEAVEIQPSEPETTTSLQTPVADEPAAADESTNATQTTQPPKYPTDDTAQSIATPPPAAAKINNGDIQTRLKDARQAYWNRDMAGAEARYKGLANDAPDNADILGELGNLYYAQQRMDEAAEMFHRAGVLLIKNGKPQQVMSLIGVLQSIAPNKAGDLRSRLSQ